MLQTAVHAGPMFCQVPVASQVCGCCPLHCVAPGVHVPPQAPPTHTYAQTDPEFCQVPDESQVCGWPVLQREAPGVHMPEQAPDTHAWSLHAVGLPS
jgi:hypothetical protein